MDNFDDEQQDSSEEMNNLLNKLMPWRREIIIVLFIILIMLVVFLGFAYGGLKVCNDLDGILDSSFKCHPDYKPEGAIEPVMEQSLFTLNYTPKNVH